jgi:putative methionine-R-sulfoxide reductase with GAF domain
VHDAEGALIAVLDVDSEHLATFDEDDRVFLERIVSRFARVNARAIRPAAG